MAIDIGEVPPAFRLPSGQGPNSVLRIIADSATSSSGSPKGSAARSAGGT